VYQLQIINASESPIELQLSATGLDGLNIATANERQSVVQIEPASNKLVPVVVTLPAGVVEPGLHDIQLLAQGQYQQGGQVRVTEQSSFYVPK
jgi:polyferredoxin